MDPTDDIEVRAFNDNLANRVLTALQGAIDDGSFGEAKMILAALTIIEVLDAEGNSRLQLVMTDTRLSLNMGLVSYAQIALGQMS